MSVNYRLTNDTPSVYFDAYEQQFRIGIYCYDGSKKEMDEYPDVIRLSFDQEDTQGNVLKDGITFEMELNIKRWLDVAEIKADDSSLINEFINHMGDDEKLWFEACYQKAKNQVK